MHCALYEFFRDQGSIIAGVLALIAGFLAYWAGRVQATETRKAAATQIAARDAEIKSADRAAADAIRREIIEFTELIIEALRICAAIKSDAVSMARKNAHSIMTDLDPIIYRKVADRIGRLPYPQYIVKFYMRIVNVRQAIQIISVGGSGEDSVPGAEAAIIAKSLIIACRLAQAIISRSPDPSLDEQVSSIALTHIDEALERAKQSFP